MPECEAALRALLPAAYGAYYWAVSSGDKKGYSGVVVIAKGAVHSEVDGQPSATSTPAGAASPTPKGKAAAKTKSIASFFAPAATAASGSGKGASGTESATASASATESSSSSSPVRPQPAWGGAGAPLRVTYGLGAQASHRGEGRAVTLTFAAFHITFCYVPNAGEGLKRLDFRLKEWERDMIAHVQWLRAGSGSGSGPQLQSGLPVCIGGDLNCAHDDGDMYNFGAKHLLKQAGCTPDERQAFTRLLDTAALVDSFRSVHGADTHGCFTYWSQRAGNRPLNRGLRLDYFLVSRELAGGESAATAAKAPPHGAVSLRDSYISDLTVGVSDHAPVVLDLTLA